MYEPENRVVGVRIPKAPRNEISSQAAQNKKIGHEQHIIDISLNYTFHLINTNFGSEIKPVLSLLS